MKLVSAVVPNWNGREYIGRCLECVFGQTYWPMEVIVVDNGSTDGSAEIVEALRDVILVRSPRNRGFAWAMNRGIERSSGEYVLSLNSDVFLSENFVELLVGAAESASDVGSAVGRTLKQGTGELLHTGFYLRKRIGVKNVPDPESRCFVFGAGGAAVLYRREMLEDVKLAGEFFDESFFSFWEDVDLSWRAQLYGWRCIYVPEAVAHHVGSGSLGGRMRFLEKPPSFQRHIVKNRYLTLTKNISRGLFLRLLPYLVLAEVLSWAYLALRIPWRLPHLAAGVSDFLRELPSALRKRRIVQGRARVADDYMYRWFRGF